MGQLGVLFGAVFIQHLKKKKYKSHFLTIDFGSKFSNLGMCGNLNYRKFIVSSLKKYIIKL